MTDTLLEYPYRPRTWMMLGGAVFFGACAVTMAHAALTNDRGLILNGVFTFSVDGATIFYWCLAAASALFVAAAVFALVWGLANPMSVRLTATELSAPSHGFARKPTSIALKDIANIGTQMVQSQRFITVYHRKGKLNLAQSMLPNARAFDELHAALVARVGKIGDRAG